MRLRRRLRVIIVRVGDRPPRRVHAQAIDHHGDLSDLGAYCSFIRWATIADHVDEVTCIHCLKKLARNPDDHRVLWPRRRRWLSRS